MYNLLRHANLEVSDSFPTALCVAPEARGRVLIRGPKIVGSGVFCLLLNSSDFMTATVWTAQLLLTTKFSAAAGFE